MEVKKRFTKFTKGENDMDGKEQVLGYAALAGWQPGDLVDVQSFGRAEILEVLHGGILVVRLADGASFRVRQGVCKRVAKTQHFRTATVPKNRPLPPTGRAISSEGPEEA